MVDELATYIMNWKGKQGIINLVRISASNIEELQPLIPRV